MCRHPEEWDEKLIIEKEYDTFYDYFHCDWGNRLDYEIFGDLLLEHAQNERLDELYEMREDFVYNSAGRRDKFTETKSIIKKHLEKDKKWNFAPSAKPPTPSQE